MKNFISDNQYQKSGGIYPQKIGETITIKGIDYRIYGVTDEGVLVTQIKIKNEEEDIDLVYENC